MIIIPLKAEVACTDGRGGVSTHVIIDPVTHQVSHYVIKEHVFPHVERIVEIHWVIESTPELIRLRCTREQLAGMEPFMRTEYVRRAHRAYDEFPVQETLWMSDVPTAEEWVPLEVEHVPVGEEALSAEAHVQATDGYVGRVLDLLADPSTGRISHLVLAKGHLWGKKEIAIPASAIREIDEDFVYLDLDREGVGSLPTISTRHQFAWTEGARVELITMKAQDSTAASRALEELQHLAQEGAGILNGVAAVRKQVGDATLKHGVLTTTTYDALFDELVHGLTGLSSAASGNTPLQTGRHVSLARAQSPARPEAHDADNLVIALVAEDAVEAVLRELSPLGDGLDRQPLTDEVATQIIVAGGAVAASDVT